MRHAEIVGSDATDFVMELKEWHCVQRLFAYADQVTAHAVVDDALLGYVGQLAIDFENSDTGRDDHRQLAGSIETSVKVMFLENVERHVEHLQEISLSRTRVDTLFIKSM